MEFDLWVWLSSQKEHLAIIAGVLTAFAVILKYVRGPFVVLVTNVKYMFNAKASQLEITHRLDDIMSQLVPNGGSSIKDSLDRIEDKQHFLGSFIKTQLNTHSKALFEADDLGRCQWVNRTHSRITGFSVAEVLGRGWVNVIAPECRTEFAMKWDRAVKNGSEFDEDIWYIKPDGKTRYQVHVHAYIITSRQGAPAGYLGEVTVLGPKSTEPVVCEHSKVQ